MKEGDHSIAHVAVDLYTGVRGGSAAIQVEEQLGLLGGEVRAMGSRQGGPVEDGKADAGHHVLILRVLCVVGR